MLALIDQRFRGAQSHTNIDLRNLLFSQDLPHLLRQLDTHVLPAAVHRNAINAAIRSSQVDVLEDVRGIRFRLHDLAEVDSAVLLAEDGLAGLDVDDVGESKLSKGNGFRGEEVILSARQGLGRSRAEAERSNAVCVSVINRVNIGPISWDGSQATYLKPRMPNPVTMAVQA